MRSTKNTDQGTPIMLNNATATLEDASFEGVRGMDRATLMSLALSGWIEQGQTLTLSGATGLGKTWLACALGQYACRQGHSVQYLRVPRLAEELRILHASGQDRRRHPRRLGHRQH